MTDTDWAVPAAGIVMLDGLMDSVASPAACVMLQTAAVPLFGVTVICEVSELTVVFAEIFEMVMENEYACVAPGSPVIAAPLFVLTEFAV